MTFVLCDTIAAIATAPGAAWRGIVRISGPAVADCVAPIFRTDEATAEWTSARRAASFPGRLILPGWHSPAPCDLYFWPDHRSYTRQSVIELHTIGAPPLLDAVLAAVCRGGARLAAPGEFTLRAFLAGRLDLTQAEAVLGVIDAQNTRQLDVALAQLAGGLSQPLVHLRDRLLDVLAHLEAGLDFTEEDIEFISRADLLAHLADARQRLVSIAHQLARRTEATTAPRAVLVGWPNVGKSSLFNALAGDQKAIVSHAPGTTRDYLTAAIDLDGVACQLVDTAGVEPQTGDALAAEAQTMTARGRAQSDVQLFCLDSTRPLNEWETTELCRAAWSRVVVLTKCDRDEAIHKPEAQAKDAGNPFARAWGLSDTISTSSVTGFGLEHLRITIRRRIEIGQHAESSVVAATAARCRDSVARATEALLRATQLAQTHAGEELIAAEIRLALDELAHIVGAVYTDDLLDRIFSRFCIGK
jgi:tRNA modification GTPase